MPHANKDEIRHQAIRLAGETLRADPAIRKIYWFPDENEVRLIELEENCPSSQSGEVEPFYFEASPEDGLIFPSGVAMIRPEEYGRLNPPEGWGNWDDAQELAVEG